MTLDPFFSTILVGLTVIGAVPVTALLVVVLLVAKGVDPNSVSGIVRLLSLPFALLIIERMLSRKYLSLRGFQTGSALALALGGSYAMDPATVSTLFIGDSAAIDLIQVFGRALSLSLGCFATVVITLLCLEIPVRLATSQNKAEVIPWEVLRFWTLIWLLAVGGHILLLGLFR